MDELNFTWKSEKAATNLKKHGVSFEEGRTVIFDDYARLIADPELSEEEERYPPWLQCSSSVISGIQFLPGKRANHPNHFSPKGHTI